MCIYTGILGVKITLDMYQGNCHALVVCSDPGNMKTGLGKVSVWFYWHWGCSTIQAIDSFK